MRIQTLALILLTFFILLVNAKSALAVDIPNFPACSNPQGTIKIQYSDGTHGIPGDGTQYTGSDIVYQLDNGNLMQCFCSTNGQGIQTNWWKVSALDAEQRRILINSGWTYIPNGALWGLEETPYMAQNSNFTCQGNNNSGTGGGGEILGAAASIGEVLGLASTGGNFLPVIATILGVLSIVLGLLLRRYTSRR